MKMNNIKKQSFTSQHKYDLLFLLQSLSFDIFGLYSYSGTTSGSAQAACLLMLKKHQLTFPLIIGSN